MEEAKPKEVPVNAIVDERTGIEFKHGVFHATKRVEERMTPERLIELFENVIVMNPKRIDDEINTMPARLEQLKAAKERALIEVGYWRGEYERAKKIVEERRLPATPTTELQMPSTGAPVISTAARAEEAPHA